MYTCKTVYRWKLVLIWMVDEDLKATKGNREVTLAKTVPPIGNR